MYTHVYTYMYIWPIGFPGNPFSFLGLLSTDPIKWTSTAGEVRLVSSKPKCQVPSCYLNPPTIYS